jgi:hypothetical protein
MTVKDISDGKNNGGGQSGNNPKQSMYQPLLYLIK